MDAALEMKKKKKTKKRKTLKKNIVGSSHCAAVEMNPTSIHEDVALIPGIAVPVE